MGYELGFLLFYIWIVGILWDSLNTLEVIGVIIGPIIFIVIGLIGLGSSAPKSENNDKREQTASDIYRNDKYRRRLELIEWRSKRKLKLLLDDNYTPCPRCGGDGYIKCSCGGASFYNDWEFKHAPDCLMCKNEGEIICGVCGGFGFFKR